LPIIVQSYTAEEGSTILIEEPEMHLHEDAQYKLLDMFLEIIRKNRQIIMTSHSVPLRNKAKRYFDEHVADGDKHHGIENVQFYNIQLSNEGSVIKLQPLVTMDIRETKAYMSQDAFDLPAG
jgi:predicted ATPase